jgi:hypothetical protein
MPHYALQKICSAQYLYTMNFMSNPAPRINPFSFCSFAFSAKFISAGQNGTRSTTILPETLRS